VVVPDAFQGSERLSPENDRIIWKESSIEKNDWDEEDHRKFAFVCGYLTQVAADQIIHPVVNLIAGPYYKRWDARAKHRECEVYQDMFAFGEMVRDRDFRDGGFTAWKRVRGVRKTRVVTSEGRCTSRRRRKGCSPGW
jgi:hypothetical protein